MGIGRFQDKGKNGDWEEQEKSRKKAKSEMVNIKPEKAKHENRF